MNLKHIVFMQVFIKSDGHSDNMRTGNTTNNRDRFSLEVKCYLI